MNDLPLQVRDEFPVLEECVYLNSCSTGAFPRQMERVLEEYWDTLRRWRDEAWERWWRELHGYWDALAAWIGAPSGTVVTDQNLSSLLGRLGTCFDYSGERRRIVTTDLEFPTTAFLLKGFERQGAVVDVVATDGRRIDEEQLCEAIDERTLLVVASHATFATGALLDLSAVARRAHEMGALLVIDAYQSVGVVPIDVDSLDVDVLLGGAHKWLCGHIETAFMYVRPELLRRLEPAATGWMAGDDPLSFTAPRQYADYARRFATGTPAVLPALASRPGLELVQRVGIDDIRAHSLALTTRIMARAERAGLCVQTPVEPSRRGGIVSLTFPGEREVATRLVERDFVCSYRNGLRVAPHFYNTEDEVDRFMDALCELRSEP